jgi:hypothetical protein
MVHAQPAVQSSWRQHCCNRRNTEPSNRVASSFAPARAANTQVRVAPAVRQVRHRAVRIRHTSAVHADSITVTSEGGSGPTSWRIALKPPYVVPPPHPCNSYPAAKPTLKILTGGVVVGFTVALGQCRSVTEDVAIRRFASQRNIIAACLPCSAFRHIYAGTRFEIAWWNIVCVYYTHLTSPTRP